LAPEAGIVAAGRGPLVTDPFRGRLHQDLQLAGLAPGTQKAYVRIVKQFAVHLNKLRGSEDMLEGRLFINPA
jgi:hypothetical protein